MLVAENPAELALGDHRVGQGPWKRGNGLREIAPVEFDRRAGQLPMAGGRVLAARGLDAIAPLPARFGKGEAPRRAAGRGLHGAAEAEGLEARQTQRPAPQAVPVALPEGAGLRNVAQRVRALVAVSLGVLSAAAAGGIKDDENGAGHLPFSPCARRWRRRRRMRLSRRPHRPDVSGQSDLLAWAARVEPLIRPPLRGVHLFPQGEKGPARWFSRSQSAGPLIPLTSSATVRRLHRPSDGPTPPFRRADGGG